MNIYDTRFFSKEIGNASLFRRTNVTTESLDFPVGLPLWPAFLDRAELTDGQQFKHINYTRFALEVPLEGILYGEEREEEVQVGPGEVLLIQLGEDSSFRVGRNLRARKIGVGFSGPLLSALLLETGLSRTVKIKLRDPADFLERLLELEHLMRTAKQNSVLELSTAAYRLLILLAESAEHVLPRLLTDAEAVMKNNLSASLSIDKLCEKLGTSVSRLDLLFRKYRGVSPKQFFLDLKFQYAEKLLEKTDLPLSVVGGKLGYERPMHFSRWFRLRSGMTPSEFRKNVKR